MHLLERLMVVKAKSTIKKAYIASNRYQHKGAPLHILLIGYSGKHNIGAEIRTAEIISQIKHMNITNHLKFSVLSLNPPASRHYFESDVALIPMSSIFFNDLLKACSQSDIAILTEGSCLTSVTSNIAALFFICAAGIMKAQKKLCIACGVEAGPLPKTLVKLAKKHADQCQFIARTQVSYQLFKKYGMQATLGTDTAWTFIPESTQWGQEEINRRLNIQNKESILLGISPINAFIRPIRPSITQYLKAQITKNWAYHYDKIYFYANSYERRLAYNRYLQSLAKLVKINRKKYNIVPMLIEMEPMDKSCIADLENLLECKCINISPTHYTAKQFVSLLTQLDVLITSRYHAHVLSMQVGVPCIALTKDQRLTSIFSEHEMHDYCLSIYDCNLENKLQVAFDSLLVNKTAIREKLLAKVPHYISQQVQMSCTLEKLINSAMGMSA